MKIAVYPGTFDPVTLGHVDVIRRAKSITDTLYVSVARSSAKKTIFNLEERLEMLRTVVGGTKGIIVDSFEGLTVDYCLSLNACAIVRGLRAISDFEFEFQMALTNRRLDERIETIFLMPSEQYTYLSSAMIKEIARLDGDITPFVPKECVERIKKRCRVGG
jgi:pantetheine-phosphate adenylyltransferase